jgi:hypothetical protein
MTRKNFESIAAALRLNAPSPDSNTYEAEADLFQSIVNSVARACALANPRFDHGRFETASGLKAIQNRRDSDMRLTRAA